MLGKNNENLGKIVAVIAKCLGKGKAGKDGLVDEVHLAENADPAAADEQQPPTSGALSEPRWLFTKCMGASFVAFQTQSCSGNT